MLFMERSPLLGTSRVKCRNGALNDSDAPAGAGSFLGRQSNDRWEPGHCTRQTRKPAPASR